MSEPTNNDLVERALNLLLPQYDKSPVIRGRIKSFAQALQDIRDDVFEVKDAFGLDTATGEQLEYIAASYDLDRQLNETDVQFRNRLYRKIANQKADGTIPKIRDITEAATGYDVKVVDAFPNAVHIIIDGEDNLSVIDEDFLNDIAPAGTEVIVLTLTPSTTVWTPCELNFETDAAILPDLGNESGYRMAELIMEKQSNGG